MRRILFVGALWFASACGGGAGDAPQSAWRSQLYPVAWTPLTEDAQGRFLHDFSYAGYRGGSEPLPDGSGWPVITVDADTSGAADATAAIQAAIDAAASTGNAVVALPAGLLRVDGVLRVTSSGVIVRGAGAGATRISFTRHTAMTGRAHLAVGASPTVGAETALLRDAQPRSRELFVADAGALRVGDDVVLGFEITPAFVEQHGMSGVWGPFNGTWQPFERREVVAVDTAARPHRVTLDVPVRYPALVRDGASLRVEGGYLHDVGIEGLSVATAVAWDDAWSNERTHAISFTGVKDGWIRNVASFVSPMAPASGSGAGAHLQNCGILVLRSKRVTIADCRMEAAQHRGGGGCGYLFELRQCNEVLTRDCTAAAGRHNFIQNWGFGNSGCVWLRCSSDRGFALLSKQFPRLGQLGYSEFHHSLATANLIDSCTIDDGWSAVNRGTYSSGAGHSATQNVFWNFRGSGRLRSRQFGWGYVIGTAPDVTTDLTEFGDAPPQDWLEGPGRAADLVPQSLYLDQLERRIGR